MKATKTLPPGYMASGTLDISRDKRALVLLNLAAVLVLLVSAGMFLKLLLWLRPEEARGLFEIRVTGIWGGLRVLLAVILVYALMIGMHEAAHGLFFWLFTTSKPVYAFKGYYAYVAAPDWYLPRSAYLLTALAPFILLSGVGTLVLGVAPPAWFLPLIFLLVTNASGSTGDMLVALWLLRQPSDCLANDRGEAVTLFVPVLNR